MQEQTLKVDGVLTFWSVGKYTHLETLAEGLTALGYADCVPEPRTPSAALKDALVHCFKGRDYEVKSLKNRDGFEVIRIDRGDVANRYTNRLTAKIVDNGGSPQIQFSPLDSTAGAVVAQFNEQLGLVLPDQVSDGLVKLIERLGGTRMRPRGGVYWLPSHCLGTWDGVAKVLAKCGHSGTDNTVYLVRHTWDPDSLAAVRDAFTAEVRAEAERIHSDIFGGQLGERAIEHRRQQAEDLRKKILLYEEVLNTSLASLHEQVDKAEQAEATAALVLAAGTEGGEGCLSA